MELSELLLLSFVSKNMKRLIKSSQKTRLESIRLIKYATDRMDNLCAFIPRKPYEDIIIRFEKPDETREPDFQLNVSGKTIDFRLCTRERTLPENGFHFYPVASVHKSDRESTLESIHNYFLDFFGNSTKYYWKKEFYKDLQCYVPTRLPNVSLCIGTYLHSNFTNIENLENFFSSSPILQLVQLTIFSSRRPFNPESKFYQAESIKIKYCDNMLPDVLNHFQGKQAFITCNECEILDLIMFVKRWKSGEAFRKLEYLKIELPPLDFNLILVQNIIGVKYIQANKQPPTHTLPRVFDWHYLGNTDPITSHSYVVRESDNRVASLLIEERALSFGVWDKTEEEFLRMVNFD
ncbi:unnamed protein product [Caenorhabditis nigoni]